MVFTKRLNFFFFQWPKVEQNRLTMQLIIMKQIAKNTP
jgi:hypothetical protein